MRLKTAVAFTERIRKIFSVLPREINGEIILLEYYWVAEYYSGSWYCGWIEHKRFLDKESALAWCVEHGHSNPIQKE